MTITELRKCIYAVFDEIAETGKAVELSRKGHTIVIMRLENRGKLARLAGSGRKAYRGNSDEIAGMNWEKEWGKEPISIRTSSSGSTTGNRTSSPRARKD